MNLNILRFRHWGGCRKLIEARGLSILHGWELAAFTLAIEGSIGRPFLRNSGDNPATHRLFPGFLRNLRTGFALLRPARQRVVISTVLPEAPASSDAPVYAEYGRASRDRSDSSD